MSRARRVAVVCDGHGFGGAQVYATSLVRHAPAGVECHVVTTSEHAGRFPGSPVTVVPTTVRAADAPALALAVRAFAPDLVQVNLVDPWSMLAALEAVLPLAPTVATLHMRGTEPAALGARLRRAYRQLACVVAVSREFATVAAGLGARHVVHVRNGVEPVEVLPLPRNDVPLVAALGRLTLQKGFDVLLEARPQIRVEHDLRLGGEGRERAALEEQSRRSGRPVQFTGFVPDVRAFLTGVDVLVLPSRVEALPLVLLEAVSAGVPAVATDVGDVREVLADVVRVVPAEDPAALAEAVSALLADPVERAERGRRGAERVRSALTAERMAREAWAAFGLS